MTTTTIHVCIQGKENNPFTVRLTNTEEATVRDVKRAAQVQDRPLFVSAVTLNGCTLPWRERLAQYLDNNSETAPFVLILKTSAAETAQIPTVDEVRRGIVLLQKVATAIRVRSVWKMDSQLKGSAAKEAAEC